MESLVAANLKQRPLRTAVSVVGVSLGVVLVVLTVGLARGMLRDAVDRQSNVDAELRLFPEGEITLSSNPLSLRAGYADAILNGVQPGPEDEGVEPKPPISGVIAATPVGLWVHSTTAGIGFELVDGIEYDSFIGTTRFEIVDGRPFSKSESGEPVFEVLVDRFYVERNKGLDGAPVRVGSRIEVLGNEFTVVGVYEPPVLARVKIPLDTLQALLGNARNCTFVMIKTSSPNLAEQVKADIEHYYPGNRVVLTRDLPALYSRGMLPLEVFLDVVIGLALVISVLVILLAMYTTIIERTREIGILKSLGASKLFIIGSIEKEAVVICVLGVAFGLLVSTAGKFAIEAATRLRIDLNLRWVLAAAVIGVVGGIIGAIYPAIRAANLDPVEALNYD